MNKNFKKNSFFVFAVSFDLIMHPFWIKAFIFFDDIFFFTNPKYLKGSVSVLSFQYCISARVRQNAVHQKFIIKLYFTFLKQFQQGHSWMKPNPDIETWN